MIRTMIWWAMPLMKLGSNEYSASRRVEKIEILGAL